jgi:hypothetical protein
MQLIQCYATYIKITVSLCLAAYRSSADRLAVDRNTDVSALYQGGLHCPLAFDVCRNADLRRSNHIRSLGIRAHCRRDKSARIKIRKLANYNIPSYLKTPRIG